VVSALAALTETLTSDYSGPRGGIAA